MYTNTCCTIYLASMGYHKVFIERCFLDHRKTHTSNNQNLRYEESAFVMFHGHEDLVFTGGKDWLIEGDCTIDIERDSEEARSQCMDALKHAGAYTVMAADYKAYGSAKMRHWEVSCR